MSATAGNDRKRRRARSPLVMHIMTRMNVGGPSYYVSLLAAGLRGYGWQTVLVAGTEEPREGNLRSYAASKGVQPHTIPELQRSVHPARDLVAFGKLVLLMARHRPLVVHTHMSKAGALGRLAAKLTGVPAVVHTFHGSGFEVFFDRRRARLIVEAERTLARLTDRLIVLGEQQRAAFEGSRIGEPARIRVVPLGLDLDDYLKSNEHRGQLRSELGLSASTPLVGVVARLVPIKGQDVFLQAAALLRQRSPGAKFLLVGDGTWRPDLEELSRKLGLENTALFLGWRYDLPRVYADLDVVVLPSVLDFEGTPAALIEAMAAARPVVATDVGGVSQVVRHGETGLLAAARDAQALANAIELLLSDTELGARLAANGRSFVYPRHGHERLVTVMNDLYRELARAKGVDGCFAA